MLYCLESQYYLNVHLHDREDAEAFTWHEEMAQLLKSIKGKFLLSYNNDSYIRDLYKAFSLKK